MKNRNALRIGIVGMMICLVFLLSSCSQKYPTGKDTALSVGDGRFQVLLCISYDLVDEEKDIDIADDLREYYNDEEASKLYLIGGDGYTVVDYQAATYHQYIRKIDCEQADQAVFQDENKFTRFRKQ